MRDNKSFEGVLSKFGSKVHEDQVVVSFDFKYVCSGEIQNFLSSFAKKSNISNLSELFDTPVQWKNIQLDFAHKLEVEFGDVPTFNARLTGIKVARSFKKGDEVYTYTLQFMKEQEPDVDSVLANFLNYKEVDENGKKQVVFYDIFLKQIVEE